MNDVGHIRVVAAHGATFGSASCLGGELLG